MNSVAALEWFPIHLHCMPISMASVPVRGMLMCCEWRAPQLSSVYSTNDWPKESGERLYNFMREWTQLRPEAWPECPVVFAVEAENDLGGELWLPQLKHAGLCTVQLYRDGVANRYINPFSGLTKDGTALLQSMAEYELFLDVSHLHGGLLHHVLDQAPGQRIVSHVVCRDIQHVGVASRANAMTDEELLRCDALLYGVPFIDDLVSLEGVWDMQSRDTNPDLVARHIVHLVSVVGADRVALGPDYQDAASMRVSRVRVVPQMDLPAGLAKIHRRLLQSGLSPEEVAGIFYGNAERILMGKNNLCA